MLKPYGCCYRFCSSAPAAFGRLCVETAQELKANIAKNQPPSGGCVLKLQEKIANGATLESPSRLRAAVC